MATLLLVAPLPKSKIRTLVVTLVGLVTMNILAPELKLAKPGPSARNCDDPLKLIAGKPFSADVTSVGCY